MLCLHGLSLFHPEVNVLVIEQLLEKKGSHLAVVSFPVCLLTILIGTRMLQYTADDHAHSHDPDTFTVLISLKFTVEKMVDRGWKVLTTVYELCKHR